MVEVLPFVCTRRRRQLLASPSTTAPSPRIAMPTGALNLAAVALPSWKPVAAPFPASVLTVAVEKL